MQLVIARFRENIDWLKDIPKTNAIVYNKFYDTCDYNCEQLPNIGRESHTYLHHIVTKYDKLDKHTCFLQGNPTPHCNNFIDIIKNYDAMSDFLPMGHIAESRIDGTPCHPGLDISVFREFIEIPESWVFSVGAQFIVSRNHIHKHPLEFYQKLLDMHYTYEHTPWCLERIWRFIFE